MTIEKRQHEETDATISNARLDMQVLSLHTRIDMWAQETHAGLKSLFSRWSRSSTMTALMSVLTMTVLEIRVDMLLTMTVLNSVLTCC